MMAAFVEIPILLAAVRRRTGAAALKPILAPWIAACFARALSWLLSRTASTVSSPRAPRCHGGDGASTSSQLSCCDATEFTVQEALRAIGTAGRSQVIDHGKCEGRRVHANFTCRCVPTSSKPPQSLIKSRLQSFDQAMRTEGARRSSQPVSRSPTWKLVISDTDKPPIPLAYQRHTEQKQQRVAAFRAS